MTDKEDKTVRQFVLLCRTALMYEKKNYYNERKHMAEHETHIEVLSLKQSCMLEKIFDTYNADYFLVMGYEIYASCIKVGYVLLIMKNPVNAVFSRGYESYKI